ncbi:MAG: sigma-70 family RNA polymerase sigma factor, partial [Gemmataceae bacterium]
MDRMLETIRKVVPTPDATDAELLDCFVTHHDEGAFEVLVRRHGPMVLRLCRSILHNTQDAEDAFQATFIVLMRRAPTIGQQDLLGNWLYKVAYRVALKARARGCKSHEREQQVAATRSDEVAPAHAGSEAVSRDLRPVLDEEIARLPEKYRAPIVLGYLEGKTTDETARLLGWSRGTVAIRMSRGRDLLRQRLAKRGLATSGAVILAILSEQSVMALPARLVDGTARGAAELAAGRTSGQFTPRAQELACAALRPSSGWKVAAAVVLGLGLIAAASGMLSADKPVAPAPARAATHDADPDNLFLIQWTVKEVLRESGNLEGKRIIEALALSRDARLLAAGGTDHKLKIWDLTGSNQIRVLRPHDAPITAVAFSASGRLLASASNDGHLRVGDLVSLKGISLEYQAPPAIALHFPAENQLLSGHRDGSLILWNLQARKPIGVIRRHVTEPIEHMAIASDGQNIALGLPDGKLILWNYPNSRETLLAKDWRVQALGFTSLKNEPMLFAPGMAGHQVRMWHGISGQYITTVSLLRNDPNKQGVTVQIPAVAFSPDHRLMAWSAVDGSVSLWNYQF